MAVYSRSYSRGPLSAPSVAKSAPMAPKQVAPIERKEAQLKSTIRANTGTGARFNQAGNAARAQLRPLEYVESASKKMGAAKK